MCVCHRSWTLQQYDKSFFCFRKEKEWTVIINTKKERGQKEKRRGER